MRTAGRLVTAIAVALSVAATLAFAVGLLRTRTLMYGEAEPLFEASRIRDGLVLYTDPLAGSLDYGPVPSRFFVVYPPLWSWVLSHVPAGVAPLFARAACSAAWFGLLAGIAGGARTGCRTMAWLAAGAAGGIFVVALFATSGRPDSIALLLAGTALARAANPGRQGSDGVAIDAWTGAALGLAAWTKPNVLGICAGLTACALTRGPRYVWRLALGAAAVSVPVLIALQVSSRGAWWAHLLGAIAQPLRLQVWWANVHTRAFFLAPAAAVTWLAWRARADPGVRAALFAWLSSLAWTVFSLAKTGSASNYWMEPAVAAVVIAANARAPVLSASKAALAWGIAAASSAWLTVATLGGVMEAFEREPPRDAFVRSARTRCGAGATDVILADSPGIEMVADGRVVANALQVLFLVLDGRMPAATWIGDLRRREVACAIEQESRMFHVLPEVAEAFDARFVEIERVEDWRLYALRDRAHP
jgi:hypothetical protein